jgi:hypothetical protein
MALRTESGNPGRSYRIAAFAGNLFQTITGKSVLPRSYCRDADAPDCGQRNGETEGGQESFNAATGAVKNA